MTVGETYNFLRHHQCELASIVIPAKAGHKVKLFSAIRVDSKSRFSEMPDQVRHDGEPWIVKNMNK